MITLGNLLRFHRLIELYLRATHHEPDTQPSIVNKSFTQAPHEQRPFRSAGEFMYKQKGSGFLRCSNSPRLTLTATDLLRMTQHNKYSRSSPSRNGGCMTRQHEAHVFQLTPKTRPCV